MNSELISPTSPAEKEGRHEIRVRIAPSPTGPVHLGNIHTALFNWLFARKYGGKFILRFEDTDLERSDRKWEELIYKEMRWLGLDWDEGPDVGGPYGPYRQTERLEIYRQYAERLREQGDVYYCYCSPEELDAERKAAEQSGTVYKYSRRCLHLTDAERKAKEEELRAVGRRPVLRFRVPEGVTLAWDDLIRGRIETASDTISDFVIMRGNGIPLYNFAVVVDDITMRISHVIRGEGHISNTPMQLLVYRALGQQPPALGHIGHILGTDGKKLSKRNGDAYVGDYRDRGFLPEALFNFLALLGWTPPDGQEILSREAIIEAFELERVGKSPAIFDLEKLEWMNGVYLRSLDRGELVRRALPYLQRAGLVGKPDELTAAELEQIGRVVGLYQERIKTLAEIGPATEYFFRDEVEYDEKSVQKVLKAASRPHLEAVVARLEHLGAEEWRVETLERELDGYVAEQGLRRLEVFQPIRVAVTGRTASPPLFDTLAVLGREKVLRRLRYALDHLVPG